MSSDQIRLDHKLELECLPSNSPNSKFSCSTSTAPSSSVSFNHNSPRRILITQQDWETGIHTALQPLLSKYPASGSPEWSRKDALTAFASVERDLQAQNPEMLYSELLARAHQLLEQRLRVAAGLPADDPTARAHTSISTPNSDAPTSTSESEPHVVFADSIKTWAPFPDTVDALYTLARHFKLAVLSNVDRVAFAHTHDKLSRPGVDSPFTLVLTAQDTSAYKPSLIPLTTALSAIASSPALRCAPRQEVLVVAQSLYHDHTPAKALGTRSVWIEREPSFMGAVAEDAVGRTSGVLWTWRFSTLGEMAEAVERESG